MVKRKHVAALIATLRDLADEGLKGKATRTRIAIAALDPDEVKANPSLARDLLADELGPWSVDLLAEVTRLEGNDADAEGMLWLDLALVRVLERLDTAEGASAREGRAAKCADPVLRWDLWTDTGTPPGVVRFAGVVWSRRVLERWRRGVDRPTAMVRAFAEPWNRLGHGATLDGASGEVRDARGERVAGLNPKRDVATVDLEVMRRGLPVFRSTLARRAFRFLAHEAHRAEVRGDLRPEIVLVDGGLVGLAERIDADPGKVAGKLRDMLDTGRLLDLSTTGLEVHGLWTWNAFQANAPGQRRVLEVNLNRRVFLSGAAEAMKATGANTREAKRARLLVPVMRHDPPCRVPKRAEWGRAWSVADAVLVFLVDNGADLANEGGTRIDVKAWARFVAEAGLDAGRVSILRTVLLEGDGVSPPLLAKVGADRFTLAAEHATELAFIVSRGESRKGER